MPADGPPRAHLVLLVEDDLRTSRRLATGYARTAGGELNAKQGKRAS
jgi:hypothetical protein